MSLARVYSRGQSGIDAPEVCVEVHLANGLPGLSLVGLPETAVKESKDRVRAALVNCGFEFPARRITVNLAPADLPKEGGRFDLAIALGILAASGQLPSDRLADYEFLGELSLGGELRPVRGALPAALRCRRAGRDLILPTPNAAEAALVNALAVFGADHLLGVCAHLQGRTALTPTTAPPAIAAAWSVDLAEVRGHYQAKRALQVAAAGGHNLLMMGPPGSGKSMLAQRLPTLLPLLDEDQALESAAIASVSGQSFDPARWRLPPFRHPHHSASAAAMVGGGGGSSLRPGEISLAHHGVLFLDELPEFSRKVLETLREPLESGRITLSRAAHKVEFPARFQLIAAMNPCPCGFHGDPGNRCRCTPTQIQRYRDRLSGPLLDRIDLHLEVSSQSGDLLLSAGRERSSAELREEVIRARETALARSGCLNAHLPVAAIDRFCLPNAQGQALLHQAIERLGLSHRALHRILKVARTIADLDGSEAVHLKHVSEAVGYRRLDRRPLPQAASATR